MAMSELTTAVAVWFICGLQAVASDCTVAELRGDAGLLLAQLSRLMVAQWRSGTSVGYSQ